MKRVEDLGYENTTEFVQVNQHVVLQLIRSFGDDVAQVYDKYEDEMVMIRITAELREEIAYVMDDVLSEYFNY